MKRKKIIIVLLVTSFLIISSEFVRTAEGAPFELANDRLSDSDLGVAANHTITITHNTSLAQNEYFSVTLPAPFGDITLGAVTCPSGTTASAPSAEEARCTADGPLASGTKIIILTGITNPFSAGSQVITVASHQAGGAVIENATVSVAIINNIDVSAKVDSALSFEIRPVATGTDINGALTTLTSATTSLSFGRLSVGTSSIAGQEVRVITNAAEGFSVTVEQDQNLTSAAVSDIDAFVDGTSTAPQAWQAPGGLMDFEWTYGHMGLTSDDGTLSSGDYFGNDLWVGFASTTPQEILFHAGPADGITQDKGMARVGYRIQISGLQEQGDYSSVITYIVTPTF